MGSEVIPVNIARFSALFLRQSHQRPVLSLHTIARCAKPRLCVRKSVLATECVAKIVQAACVKARPILYKRPAQNVSIFHNPMKRSPSFFKQKSPALRGQNCYARALKITRQQARHLSSESPQWKSADAPYPKAPCSHHRYPAPASSPGAAR